MRGEIISGPGNFEIEVLDADPRRVKRLRTVEIAERCAYRPRTRKPILPLFTVGAGDHAADAAEPSAISADEATTTPPPSDDGAKSQ